MLGKRKALGEGILNTLVKKHKNADKKWPDEMTPEAAKKIEKIQERMLEENKMLQKKAAEEAYEKNRTETNRFINELQSKNKNNFVIPPPPDDTPLTVEEAVRLGKLQDEMLKRSESFRISQGEEKREREKHHEPVVRELKALREELSKRDEEIKQLRSKQNKPILFRPRVMSTPSRKAFDKDQDVFEKDEVIEEQNVPEQKEIFEAETITEAAKVSLPEDEDKLLDKSIQTMVDRSGTEVGSLARQYLSNANDGTFGLTYDIVDRKLKVGNSSVTIKNDDIILDKTPNEIYTGTPGLWRLLTQSGDVGSEQYTKDDRDAYKKILIDSGAIYQSNDPASGRPKSSQGHKYKKIIKPMWEELKVDNLREGSGLKKINPIRLVRAIGAGLLTDTNCPVEYKYIKKYADLIERLYFLQSEETAGNNNFHNEKIGIVKFIYDRLMELAEKPDGHKYVIRCMLALPKPSSKYMVDRLKNNNDSENKYIYNIINFIHDSLEQQIDLPDGAMYLARCLTALPEKIIEGSGILNNLINNLPFELHAPAMNFLGPGTKLQERLARGDKGVNPLDEAAREHDIWYSKHKKAEDRWEADKKLQDKAFERVIAPDAGLYERPLALATGTAMWAKRALGMGLSADIPSQGPDKSEEHKESQQLLETSTKTPAVSTPVGNFKDIIKRVKFIRAEETAGNNCFNDEIMGIQQFADEKEKELNELKQLLSTSGSGILENKTIYHDTWFPKPKRNYFHESLPLKRRLVN